MNFTVNSKFQPAGDQPKVIKKLSKSIIDNNKFNVLEGVTGSGKTYSMAKIIEKTKPHSIKPLMSKAALRTPACSIV